VEASAGEGEGEVYGETGSLPGGGRGDEETDGESEEREGEGEGEPREEAGLGSGVLSSTEEGEETEGRARGASGLASAAGGGTIGITFLGSGGEAEEEEEEEEGSLGDVTEDVEMARWVAAEDMEMREEVVGVGEVEGTKGVIGEACRPRGDGRDLPSSEMGGWEGMGELWGREELEVP
jgi:hypothetical protein